MSLFEETFQEMESFGKEFDTTADKLRILTEYVVADYNVDIKTAQLTAKQDESITLEAVNEAYDVAYEKCMDKLKKSIGGIKRNSNDYFAKINASITKIVEDPSYQKTIETASVLCKEDCKGLCQGCGANLNIEACSCNESANDEEIIDPRFAKLKDIFKND